MSLTPKRMIDTVEITVIGGKGGDGKASFRREKYIPKGGPDGGDGGKGGDVYIVGAENMATLLDFRGKSEYKADDGEMGGSKNMTGASAEDLFIRVPLGTLVYESREGEDLLVGDITKSEQKLLIARGGAGGKGNTRFKSSTNRTPKQFTKGKLGEFKALRMEIKLIADIGLVGMPNVGKSTLINQLTSANAKVADYSFTTLSPNLGVCTYSDDFKLIIADIPGLIEGASEGKGLGDDFLRHVERTRVLVHIIDPFGEQGVDVERVLQDYSLIRLELEKYGSNLEKKPEIVLINKIDITEVKEGLQGILEAFEGIEGVFGVCAVSAVTGEGVEELKSLLADAYRASILQDAVVSEDGSSSTTESGVPTKTYTIENLPNKRMVFNDDVVEAN